VVTDIEPERRVPFCCEAYSFWAEHVKIKNREVFKLDILKVKGFRRLIREDQWALRGGILEIEKNMLE
jgi:hypothetical protein